MSGLTLGNLMTEEQLSKLINLCIGSELPWAPHALACLLQDVVDVAFTPNTESDMETDPSPASTSWGTGKTFVILLHLLLLQNHYFLNNLVYDIIAKLF